VKTIFDGRKMHLLVLFLLVVGFFSLQPGSAQAQTISFTSSGLDGESSNNPTSLQFGPDGRLYVSQQNGTIYAYNVVRNGANDYDVTNTETINLVKNIQNHNDNGVESSQNNRQVTGIYVTGTGANPILYVSSSDPRIGAGGGGNDNGLDTNSGIVSRLECIGGVTGTIGVDLECSNWEKVDLIRGLPRSEENHATNGLALDEATNTLYLAVGGHTNAGSPSNNFAFTVEYTYSSTIIAIDLDMLDTMPVLTDANNGSQYIYDLPTLDDPTRENVFPDGTAASDDPRDANYSPLDVGDPFGGNDGLNMAKIDLTGPVSIYAPGFRNLYDIVLTEGGLLYGVDNGANGGWGGHPAGEADYDAEYSSNPACTNEYLSGEPGSTGGANSGPGGDDQVNNKNGLQLIEPLETGDFNYVAAQPYYYGGHAHPILANPGTPMDFINDTFPYLPGGAGLYTQGQGGSVDNHTNGSLWRTEILEPSDPNFSEESLPVDWPPVPPGAEFIAACDFRNSGQDDNSLANYGPSTNGITEYTASNFGGALEGWLLLAGFNGNIYEVELSLDGKVALNCPTVPQNGSSTVSNCNEVFATGFGGSPLDVVAQGDDDPFGGTVWAATYGSDNITIFEPADYAGNDPGTCDGTNDDTIDEDGDGYTNADEIDPLNGTNPCSAASEPADFDDVTEFGSSNEFKRSDARDTDDDNDGILDVNDAFTFDASNGIGSIGALPLRLELFNSTGYGFGGIGFTGIMTNGTDDYFTLIDDSGDELVYGGTAGIYTDPSVSAGDAYQGTNTQQNGFQFGVDVSTATGPFTVEAQINGPFFNDAAPQNFASHGIFIGTGDQDNYLKFTVRNNNGNEAFQILVENNGSTSDQLINVPNLLDATAIKLFLSVDPTAGTVQASYSADGSPRTDVGSPVTLTGDLLAVVQGNYTIGGQPSALAVGAIATSTGNAPEFAASWDYFEVTQNPSETQAVVEVDTGGINGSTFGNSSFNITNTSTNGAQITNVTFDLSSAVIPEVVFDPNGTAGDATSKGFSPNNGSDATTGVTAHNFSNAYEGGFYGLSIDFNDFAPNETLQFGLDVDPVSIKGGTAPGPNDSGSVSGVELSGATVSVTFDTGEIWTVDLFREESDNSDSINIARNALPQPASIEMTGVDNQSTAFTADQEIVVTGVEGSVGQTVRLLQLETGLFVEDLTGPYAGVGYDIDPWEINSLITINEFTDTIDNSNVATFNVTLTDSDPEAGYNLFVAVIEDDDGATSPISNVILVEYDPDAAPTIVYRFNTEQETITATDGGPDWIGMGGAGAQSGTGWAVNTGSISTHNISERDDSVPDYVPQAIFDKERWDQPSGDEMEFTFDVDPGTYQVNLLLGNGYSGTSAVGERVFDISIEGTLVQNDLDLIPTFGHQVGGMLTYIVSVDDGTLNILMEHVVENPTINGIEILRFGGSLPISIDPIADQSNVEGDDIGNLGLLVSADGGEGNLSYQATGLPAGVQLEPTNGQFFGTINVGAAASSPYNVVVTVDDSDGDPNNAVTTNFVWTVDENNAPVIDPIATLGGVEGDTLSTSISASDIDGDDIALSIAVEDDSDQSAVTGFNFTDNQDGTASFSWDTTASAGSYTATVTADDGKVQSTATFAILVASTENTDIDVTGDFDFDGQTVGQTSDPQTITITNVTGDVIINNLAAPLAVDEVQIQSIEIGGQNAEEFSTTLSQQLPINLLDGQSTTFDLTYTPSNFGTSTATITIVYIDDQGTPKAEVVQIEGLGLAPIAGEVLYRVNTGGPELAATDDGPVWEQDQGNFGGANNSANLVALSSGGSTYSQSSGSAYQDPIVLDASVPADTPAELFTTERYDAESAPEMLWQFDVPAGTDVEIRIYFAEIFSNITAAGQRVFSVSVDGTVPPVFTDIDQFDSFGATTGFMLSYVTTSDGVIDLEFIHSIENPAIKGIEIVTITTEAPVIDPIADVTSGVLGEYDAGRFVVSAGDPQGDDITFGATGLPDGLTIDPDSGEIQGTISVAALTGGTNNDGVHDVTITVTDDSAEQNSSTETFTFTVVERTVTLLSPLDGATVPSSGFTVEWESTGGSTDVYEHVHVILVGGEYSDDGTRIGSLPLNGSVNFPTAPYTNLAPGNYQIILRMAYPTHIEFDPAVVIPDVIDITIVESVNQPPIVTNPGTQNNVEGDVVSLPIVASDPDVGQDLTYAATNLPPSLDIDPDTGVISGTLDVGSTAGPDGAFIEENGLVVIEMESGDLPNNWETIDTYSTTTSPNVNNPTSAAGGDFIIWQAGQNLGNQGVGLITYQVQITNPGTYQFSWYNQVGNGTETTEHNDSWLKIEADQFYGSKNGGASIVCPNGAAANTCPSGASSPNGASGNGWFKIYSSGANNWKWQASTSDDDAHNIFAVFDAPGTYNILVSARSSSHAIDRMVLFQVGEVSASQAQNLSNPESDRVTDTGSDGAAENSPYTVDVEVTDNGNPAESTTVQFVWNVLPTDEVPSALVEVNPNAGVNASTFGNDSFQISNTGEVDITNVTINSSTTFMPDVVFDPVGKAGDNGAKCLTTGGGGDSAAAVGLTVPGNGGSDAADCESVFEQPHNGVDDEEGYDILTLDFTDFNPGEQYNFGVDMDPTTIKGDLSTGDAGSISGFELIGATVTISFADGTTITTTLTDQGSLGGSAAVIEPGLPTPPLSIAAQGVSAPAVVSNPGQIIVISGEVGEEVFLLQVDGRLYIDPGNPGIGYDVDPFEANEAVAKVIYTGTIPADGTLEVPVTLLETAGSGGAPDAGINHFIAFHTDEFGDPVGLGSNVIILELGDEQQLASLTGTVSLQGYDAGTYAGVPVDIALFGIDGNTPSSTFFDDTALDANGEFTLQGLEPGTYEVAVKHSNHLQIVETITLVAGSNSLTVRTLPAGDVNDDNQVTALDFSALATTFNLSEGDANYNAGADFNGDDAVTALDFSLLTTNFNVSGEIPDNQ